MLDFLRNGVLGGDRDCKLFLCNSLLMNFLKTDVPARDISSFMSPRVVIYSFLGSLSIA